MILQAMEERHLSGFVGEGRRDNPQIGEFCSARASAWSSCRAATASGCARRQWHHRLPGLGRRSERRCRDWRRPGAAGFARKEIAQVVTAPVLFWIDNSIITLQILSIVFYTFIAFLCIGLPIAVLPICARPARLWRGDRRCNHCPN